MAKKVAKEKGLFAGMDSGDFMMASQIGGALGDMGTRQLKGDLAAAEAATAPFAKGSILDAFEQGPAGSDLAGAAAEGYALRQKAKERDRIQELLSIFGEEAFKTRKDLKKAAEAENERSKVIAGDKQ